VKKVYLDTSAFIKIFVEEDRQTSDIVERIIDLARNKKIIIILSDWVINESFAVIDKNKQNGKITKSETQQILSELVSMLKAEIQYETFTIYSITEKIVVASRYIIQDYHIAASDALHVFISASAECDCFVSADKKLERRLTTGIHKLVACDIGIKKDVKIMFERIINS